MANKLILKRSSVAAKVPLSTDLEVGELAVNLADAKLYTKNSGGTVIELTGGGGGGASVTVSTTAPVSPSAGDLWWDSENGVLKLYYNDGNTSQWVDASAAGANGTDGTDGVGVPVGGTTGQILVKASGTDYDTEWTNAVAGATGGGDDQVFYENDQTITTSYTITSGRNAMSAGPILIDTGATVTIPSGSVWTIV